MTEIPTDYARKVDGKWRLVTGPFTVESGGRSTGAVDPDLPNGVTREVIYDLKFAGNWLELSTAEDRAQWGILPIAPPDSPPEGAYVLGRDIIEHNGGPKYRIRF